VGHFDLVSDKGTRFFCSQKLMNEIKGFNSKVAFEPTSRLTLQGSQDEDFHDVIAERYERKSTIVTSNLDIPEWTGAFSNRILGAATIDRLRHGAYKVVLDGESYRSTKPAPKAAKTMAEKPEKMTEKTPPKGSEKP